jgi:gamma-glutamylcyclotransferase (GGCT)/AIG2-like uncharacterized protein YtfP
MTQGKKNDNNAAEGAAMTGSVDTNEATAKREEATKTVPTASNESEDSKKKGRKDDFSIVLPLKHHHLTREQYLALQPTTSLPLFVYGSLLIPHILHNVTSSQTPMVTLMNNTTEATLYGYRRHALRDAAFPAIIPNENHFVVGALVLGLNDEEKQAIDNFESGLYDKVEVDVEIEMVIEEMPGGWLLKTEIVKAEAYVWNFSTPALEVVPAEEKEWSIEPLVRGTWGGKK